MPEIQPQFDHPTPTPASERPDAPTTRFIDDLAGLERQYSQVPAAATPAEAAQLQQIVVSIAAERGRFVTDLTRSVEQELERMTADADATVATHFGQAVG